MLDADALRSNPADACQQPQQQQQQQRQQGAHCLAVLWFGSQALPRQVVAPLLVLRKRRRIQQLMLVWTPPAQTAVGGGRSSVTPVALAWVRLP